MSENYPPGLPDGLRPRFHFLLKTYLQLENLWSIQLGDDRHRTYWNIKAAHEFWCEYGPKTLEGRRYGWSERWIVDAIEEIKAELIRLTEMASTIREREAKALEVLGSPPAIRTTPQTRKEGKVDHVADVEISETETEICFPGYNSPQQPSSNWRRPRCRTPTLESGETLDVPADRDLNKGRSAEEDSSGYRQGKYSQSCVNEQPPRLQTLHCSCFPNSPLYRAQAHQEVPHSNPRGADKPPECQPH